MKNLVRITKSSILLLASVSWSTTSAIGGEGVPLAEQAAQNMPTAAPEAAPEAAASEVEKATPVAKSADAAEIAKEASPQEKPKARQHKQIPKHYESIVRVENSKKEPNYAIPWQAGNFAQGTGTAFLVAPNLFMTNAHVVANAETIYISKYGDARKIPAKVRHIAHDCDLALIEIDESETSFVNVKQLTISDELPRLEEEVRAIGYPVGGSRLSVTRGIVSRIETNSYAHSRNNEHLTVQIDAAINPGNSGGPVFKGNEVIGVAFQGLISANSTGYIIPAPVIQRFLKDVSDGHYDKYVNIGAEFFPIQNPAMRKHYNLPNNGQGVLVGDIIVGGSSDGILQIGDVVLAINGLPVDSSAMIELDGERVPLSELAERSFMGDQLQFSILRDGKQLELITTLRPPPQQELTSMSFDKMPRYVVYGGLVFQPLTLNEIIAHKIKPQSVLADVEHFVQRGGSKDKQDLVILTQTLPDEVNARFSDYGNHIVTKVNGVEVSGLSQLYQQLYAPKDDSEYCIIELKDAALPLIFERKTIEDANRRIHTNYAIPEHARLHSQP